jgi:hypothetical protein
MRPTDQVLLTSADKLARQKNAPLTDALPIDDHDYSKVRGQA